MQTGFFQGKGSQILQMSARSDLCALQVSLLLLTRRVYSLMRVILGNSLCEEIHSSQCSCSRKCTIRLFERWHSAFPACTQEM